MMAAGKYASLPRKAHGDRKCSLASSMEALDKGGLLSGQHSSYLQSVSIHGTLPRKSSRKHSLPAAGTYGPLDLQPLSLQPRLHKASWSCDVIDEYPSQDANELHSGQKHIADFALDYVKFSKDRYIMDSTPERLRKELEEELKLNGEDLRGHAWYHGRIPRKVAESLIQRDGDFLVRDSLSSPGNHVLTCQWRNAPHHFKISRVVVRLSEGYSRLQYQFERESFDSVPALVRCYVGNRRPIYEQVGAIIFQPINRTLPLRWVEETYGTTVPAATPVKEQICQAPVGKTDTAKRLSWTLPNGSSNDRTLSPGNLLRNKDKSGSQPASLDYVPDRRQPLKSHQSESYLPLGMRSPPTQLNLPQHQHQHQQPFSRAEGPARNNSLVFRTGSEPALSPTYFRPPLLDTQAGEALRGSDSQLCPKPPPKPSKVPSLRMPNRPLLAKGSTEMDNHAEMNAVTLQRGHAYCGQDSSPDRAPVVLCLPTPDGFVERLRTDEASQAGLQGCGSVHSTPRGSPILFAVSPLQDEEGVRTQDSLRPVFENTSCFRPNEFQSKLLPPDNKPLDTSVIRRVKELFTKTDSTTIAKHILKVDSQVARILNVSDEIKQQMQVSSGLELITLPQGHQLRLDLIERYNTLTIGIAVDILGCTGSVEERAAVLAKIIQLALELKYSMGDLYAFSAIMKTLDMPQITRLEQTWIALRHKHTKIAIVYEKTLKPCIKALNEGREDVALSKTTIPHLMPLITLMERQFVTFETTELWETIDQGCEIMHKHLDDARSIAHNAAVYKVNTKRILEDFEPDEEMLETFQTEFAMRLLWGSKGAQVNQTERYEKFTMILTALSRKLEPPSWLLDH
ncbi:breast cancer anti-estrogen resistance protein 3 isoform X1 [Leucoraja erinacea]|uniref:breast cancer anti-estrogen resistance protein 3 isoform X1 n=1 Tax=Leucoraja erinaceus TaxID=7782 RepID=UPI00245794EA|nr:breast cancer anti-estrogen resistance protein 3 isoform X1 [Leucoraja erinacea]XP_055497419.1 breast cancer anti-estrogen resistance protein 3 isoform X1 [Leucoraja erinacea]XP_055497420.1 breast cancer anti-estrogen resistance protein 3 isoform X1 [Leucoraja erinacea]